MKSYVFLAVQRHYGIPPVCWDTAALVGCIRILRTHSQGIYVSTTVEVFN